MITNVNLGLTEKQVNILLDIIDKFWLKIDDDLSDKTHLYSKLIDLRNMINRSKI